MTNETVLKEIEKILNIKQAEVTNLTRFRQGMSNYTYYFEVNQNKYVIRLIGEGASKYINYYDELNSISVVQFAGLTSELIYFDIETGTKMTKYIEGSVIDLNNDEANIEQLISSLKKLHNINQISLPKYNLIERLNLYESFNDLKLIDNKYFEIKDWWINFYNKNYRNNELHFCHNDLQDANIIQSTTGKVYFIDFEYAALNDIYYDFASFEDNAFNVFENYYNKTITKEEKNHIYFYQIYQAIQWYQVATYKESIGFSQKTNYDFKELMNYFLNKAFNLYKNIK